MKELLNRQFDFNQEILSIDKLFYDIPEYGDCSLYDVIKDNFKRWRYRSNYISLDQFFSSTGIYNIVDNAEKNLCNIDDFIYYAECIQNLIYFLFNCISEAEYYLRENKKIIFENINNIIESSNLQLKYLKEKECFVIIPDKWKVNESVNIIKNQYSLGEKILLYYHNSMRGKLFDKADILCRFYKAFEDKYRNQLNANGYKNIASDIGFLSDKLDVRHAPSKNEKKILDDMSKEELENWYDKLFNLYLDTLILCDHIETHKEINDLKLKLK